MGYSGGDHLIASAITGSVAYSGVGVFFIVANRLVAAQRPFPIGNESANGAIGPPNIMK